MSDEDKLFPKNRSTGTIYFCFVRKACDVDTGVSAEEKAERKERRIEWIG